jgi:hypothetical protein
MIPKRYTASGPAIAPTGIIARPNSAPRSPGSSQRSTLSLTGCSYSRHLPHHRLIREPGVPLRCRDARAHGARRHGPSRRR